MYGAFGRCDAVTLVLVHIDYDRNVVDATPSYQSISTKIASSSRSIVYGFNVVVGGCTTKEH